MTPPDLTAPTMLSDLVAAVVPPPAAYRCSGGCGATVDRPGACEPCGAAFERRAHNATLRWAYDSIPDRFQWARLGAPELGRRCPAAGLHPELVTKLAKLPERRDLRIVVLFGTSGAGKTSLACALLRAVIDAGRFGAPPEDYDRARRARFFEARDIANGAERGETPAKDLLARATFAVVDDVGQESGTGDTYGGSDRARALADALAKRHNDPGAQTIVTTYAQQSDWSRWYGDGLRRRYWTGDDVRVIDMDRLAKSRAA